MQARLLLGLLGQLLDGLHSAMQEFSAVPELSGV
jgi:hypothetical protein